RKAESGGSRRRLIDEFSSAIAKNIDRLSPYQGELSLSLLPITDEFKFKQETHHDPYSASRRQRPSRPRRQGPARFAQPQPQPSFHQPGAGAPPAGRRHLPRHRPEPALDHQP